MPLSLCAFYSHTFPTLRRWFKDAWLSRLSLLDWLADGPAWLPQRSTTLRPRRLSLKALEPR